MTLATRTHRIRTPFAVLVALGLALAGAVAAPMAAYAADHVVLNGTDHDAGSLRNMLAGASSGDTVIIPASITSIVLESPLLVRSGITIQGPGADVLTISRTDNTVSSIFDLSPILMNQDYTIRDMTLTGVTFFGIPPVAKGPAIKASQGPDLNWIRDLTVERVVFDTNFADNGAGIFVPLGRNVTVNDSTFIHNEATVSGGAIAVSAINSLTVNGGLFDDNESESDGGAISMKNSGPFTMDGSRLQLNATDDDGGAIELESTSDVIIRNAVFDENEADSEGGALSVQLPNASVTIEQTLFSNNDASEDGGAYHQDETSGDVAFTGVRFENNDSNMNGGGAFFGQLFDSLTIANSTFIENDAVDSGGGLFIDEVDQGVTTIDSSTFAGNYMIDGEGLGLYIGETSGGTGVVVVNSTFDEHEDAGYAAFTTGFVDGDLEVSFSTISAEGPAISINDNDGAVLVTHSILQSVLAPSAVYVDTADDQIDVEWSLFSTAIDADFVNDLGHTIANKNPLLGPLAGNGGITPTRLLLTNSPALNAGGASYVDAPAVDQRGAGYPRLAGGAYDLGAIEMPAALAATGSTALPAGAPIAGGVVLLLGIGAVVFSMRTRRTRVVDSSGS